MNVQRNATGGPTASQSVSKVVFDKLSDNYLLISGMEAFLVKIDHSSGDEKKPVTPQKGVIRRHLSQCNKVPFVKISEDDEAEA